MPALHRFPRGRPSPTGVVLPRLGTLKWCLSLKRTGRRVMPRMLWKRARRPTRRMSQAATTRSHQLCHNIARNAASCWTRRRLEYHATLV